MKILALVCLMTLAGCSSDHNNKGPCDPTLDMVVLGGALPCPPKTPPPPCDHGNHHECD